jgi:hypothetical protein
MPRPYHPIRSILILTSHLCLCLLSGLFHSGFPTNILYAFLFSPIRATCPVRTSTFYLRTILTLVSLLRLCVLSGLFASGFATNTLHAFLFPPIRATCQVHTTRSLLCESLVITAWRVLSLRRKRAPGMEGRGQQTRGGPLAWG